MFKIYPLLCAKSRSAFSLIELLIASAVLVLILLLVSKVLEATTRTTNYLNQRTSAEAEARRVFDRMAVDFSAKLVRKDIDCAYQKNVGNDTFRIITQVEGLKQTLGANPSRAVSVVEYFVDGQSRLLRGARSLGWSDVVFITEQRPPQPGGPAAFVANSYNTTPIVNTTTYDHFDVLGKYVLRMEIAYLLAPNLNSNPVRLRETLSSEIPQDAKISDIRAVLVGLILLDNRARAPLTANQLKSLANLFPDYTPADASQSKDILSVWNAVLDNPSTFNQIGIPRRSAQHLRAYQRYFTITPAPITGP